MEMTENGKYLLNIYEPKIESNESSTDKLVIRDYLGCCMTFVISLFGILFMANPIIFYYCLFRVAHKQIIVIDKKSKTLIIGDRGIFGCCSCCIFKKKTYFLNGIKNVKIQVISKDNPNVGFDKLYFINGYIYSQKDECETLFTDIEYTNEKYNNFVSFFKKYIHTIEEPLEMIKNEFIMVPKDNDDYPSNPETNEGPAMAIIP